jgi:hypothetical protein
VVSSGTLISSTNKADCHAITEILLKMALNTINLTNIKAGVLIVQYLGYYSLAT